MRPDELLMNSLGMKMFATKDPSAASGEYAPRSPFV